MIQRHASIQPMHPGVHLREIVVPALDMSKKEIAEALSISRNHLYDILSEKKPISMSLAIRLGAFLGNGPEIWANMQSAYDLHKAKETTNTSNIEPARMLEDA